jgi:hypothetical protein
VSSDRSTLFTSPLSAADFVLRLVFFASAPVAIVFAAELFPIRGAIIDVGLALGLFIAGEAVQGWASKTRVVRWFLREALAFEAYYRSRPPRPFVYYLAYPILFPYWIFNRDARQEFLLFRGYTLGGLLILLVSLGWQYWSSWAPELSIPQYIPYVLLTLVVESLLALALLMPIATTVVWYHSSFRRARLVVVLLAGLISTSIVFYRVMSRRSPIVSFATRERVALRTQASQRKAHRALLKSVRAARKAMEKSTPVEGDGAVMGVPLEQASSTLEEFYKHDEAYAFSLWASPRRRPNVLVLYFEARRKQRPIWVAIGGDGTEIRTPSQLPRGAFRAMLAASDADDALLEMWPDALDLQGYEDITQPSKSTSTSSTRKASSPSPSVTSSARKASDTFPPVTHNHERDEFRHERLNRRSSDTAPPLGSH